MSGRAFHSLMRSTRGTSLTRLFPGDGVSEELSGAKLVAPGCGCEKEADLQIKAATSWTAPPKSPECKIGASSKSFRSFSPNDARLMPVGNHIGRGLLSRPNGEIGGATQLLNCFRAYSLSPLSSSCRSSEEDMKVRLDFDIPAEEKVFLVKRKEVVSRALQKILNLQVPLDPTQVPTVAVVCSGGGSRAMTGTYGSLKGLQSLGLLDVITYMTSVSGSTWTTANLYTNPFWSKENLDEAIGSVQRELSKSPASLFSRMQLHYYRSELQNREKEGYSVSFIDTWGLIIEQLVFGKKQTDILSDQKKVVSEGQNPLPIYTAVNIKKGINGSTVPEWCEFTPFEVGFCKYGAFVPVENFGSEFYLGHVVKKLPETRISFLLDSNPDAFPNKLTPMDSTLSLVDSAFAINIAFPPVLRPQRCADIILSFSYSWDEDPLQVVKKTQQYCIDHQVPFPKIDFSKYTSQHKEEVYVFMDEKNPDAPIVLHFPLVNVSFKDYKAPGVKRIGKQELKEGNIDVNTKYSPYVTSNLTYSSEDFQRLVDLSHYNIVNNKKTIINALKKALNKKGAC
ncbi:cytosolic phospholipase A2 zeta-like [Clarias gariepinus]